MAKNSLIKKLIDILFPQKYEHEAIVGYYIPSRETMQKVAEGMHLSPYEINDYVNYIKSNYYVSADDSAHVLDFAGDWVKNKHNEQEIFLRQGRAINNIVTCLSQGEPIDVLDALWVSNKVYVDSIEPSLKRCITKEHTERGYHLRVETQQKNFYVGIAIDELKRKLNDRMLSKPVANTL